MTWNVRNSIIAVGCLAVGAFLLGIVPATLKARSAQSELAQARKRLQADGLALTIGSAYVNAAQKNYGLAATGVTRFFDRVQSLSTHADTAEERRRYLASILAKRDEIMTRLAQADAAVLPQLELLFQKEMEHAAGAG